jgi:acetylornithine deacetylase/succinyl-diaminopimelate desuccinylase-like protein
MRTPTFAVLAAALVTLTEPPFARGQTLDPPRALAHDIFKELIEINTTDSVGSTTKAAEAMAARLRAAGFPEGDVRVLGPNDRKGNLVARLRGSGAARPLLLLAHLDVVEARREDWSVDPFTFLEKDGYYYGRGTTDDKAMAAIFITNLIRFKQEGFKPDRDLIVALTADEEGGDFNGVQWLVANHRELVEAELAINEGGGGSIKDGRYIANRVQASEKVYQDFTLEVKNPGGHSSLPVKDNAIYHLAAGLARLAEFDFPVKLNEVTRALFGRLAATQPGPLGDAMKGILKSPRPPGAVEAVGRLPYLNAMMRTTCVATMLQGGHAANALPQTARANVNCRMLPGDTTEDVRATLVGVLADGAITVAPVAPAKPSAPSPLRPEVMGAIERITEQMWPGVPVTPVMGTGATDGLYLRRAGIPTYGVDGIFENIDDTRAHGKDERIGVKQFYEGQEFLYRLMKALASPPS